MCARLGVVGCCPLRTSPPVPVAPAQPWFVLVGKTHASHCACAYSLLSTGHIALLSAKLYLSADLFAIWLRSRQQVWPAQRWLAHRAAHRPLPPLRPWRLRSRSLNHAAFCWLRAATFWHAVTSYPAIGGVACASRLSQRFPAQKIPEQALAPPLAARRARQEQRRSECWQNHHANCFSTHKRETAKP